MPSGVIKREPIHCSSEEVCKVKDGVRKCYPQVHQCLITESGALTMFGGMGGIIDVMGTFQIVKVCDGALVADWFRVVVHMGRCGHLGLKRIVGVDIFFEEFVIMINSKHETWVTTIHV